MTRYIVGKIFFYLVVSNLHAVSVLHLPKLLFQGLISASEDTGMSMRTGWMEGVGVGCCEKGVLQTPARLPCCPLSGQQLSARRFWLETLGRTGTCEW